MISTGYKNIGFQDVAKEVLKKTDGTALAKMLTDRGWDAVYYRRDTKEPGKENESAFSDQIVQNKSTYYDVKVSATVRNYCWPRCEDRYDSQAVSDLVDMDFGFISGGGGRHTSLYSNGGVYEVHWDQEGAADGNDKLYEKTDFNKWQPEEGNRVGGAGIIVVPPKTPLPGKRTTK